VLYENLYAHLSVQKRDTVALGSATAEYQGFVGVNRLSCSSKSYCTCLVPQGNVPACVVPREGHTRSLGSIDSVY